IRAGRKVAICDQMEDPATVKGIVRREVTKIVTPGTVTEENVLSADVNNYIVAVSFPKNGEPAFVALDISTGEFFAETAPDAEALAEALRRLSPREAISSGGVLASDSSHGGEDASATVIKSAGIACVTPVDSWLFDEGAAFSALTRHFKVRSLEGFGCADNPAIATAAGALLQYVSENLRRDISHITSIRRSNSAGYMALDEAAFEHLDLLPGKNRETAFTLYGVLNATRTPMGARLLRTWISRPLQRVDEINARHDAIETFMKNRAALGTLRGLFANARDLERLIARVSSGHCLPRDIAAVSAMLGMVPEVRGALDAGSCRFISKAHDDLDPLASLVFEINATLADELPAQISDGGIIRSGVNAELDDLRDAAAHGREWIARYQAEQVALTGIQSLKVKHNNIFGYFIEIPTHRLSAAPAHYIRRQTLSSGERFTTPELKEWEMKISGASDKALIIEKEMFGALREKFAAQTARIQKTAAAFAALDVACALTDRALALGYVRPAMNGGEALNIVAGRHPVIEQLPEAERFVPNDANLDCESRQIIVITGPNMAGKSTYIRQVGMLVVMAQIGSFIPAESAEIGVVDRVFTRVGAGDDLTRGRSTFMVEMQETANILNNATRRSLIILDEIGRGTSTFDGISIAWAVAEYLHDNPAVKAKTLFATHYHELTDLAAKFAGVVNCSVLVREQGEGIAFLRRITEGPADKSYGIAVARLAGMPAPVIARAREVLANLEANEYDTTGAPSIAQSPPNELRAKKNDENQLLLF
ncbi:MAG: DNA mismatch repair protein MutS, partial [Kiritimatiellaeota bacterium]|nr:DNA mismatch repair protein MutS [Kiritimatiellota bacterium]